MEVQEEETARLKGADRRPPDEALGDALFRFLVLEHLVEVHPQIPPNEHDAIVAIVGSNAEQNELAIAAGLAPLADRPAWKAHACALEAYLYHCYKRSGIDAARTFLAAAVEARFDFAAMSAAWSPVRKPQRTAACYRPGQHPPRGKGKHD